MISGGFKVDSILRAIKNFEASPKGFSDIADAVAEAGLDFLRPSAIGLQKVVKAEPKTFVGSNRFAKAAPSPASKRAEALAHIAKEVFLRDKEAGGAFFAEWFSREIVPLGVLGRDIHDKKG